MTQPDKRVRRTQQRLRQALIELTLEKGYEALTIRDLTARADVGYATFFRHYPDKDALLEEVLDSFLAELQVLVPPEAMAAEPAVSGQLIFEYVAARSQLFQVLLASRGSTTMLRRVRNAGIQELLTHRQPRPGSVVPLEVAAYHLVSATINLIQWWLEQGMPYSPAEMGQIYGALILAPTANIAFAPSDA